MTDKYTPSAAADSSDVVWGARGVGEVINAPVSRVNYMIRTGKLPVRRFGDRIVASRRELLAAVLSGNEAA